MQGTLPSKSCNVSSCFFFTLVKFAQTRGRHFMYSVSKKSDGTQSGGGVGVAGVPLGRDVACVNKPSPGLLQYWHSQDSTSDHGPSTRYNCAPFFILKKKRSLILHACCGIAISSLLVIQTEILNNKFELILK
ncbi:hypothetical protein COCON_G00169060 [Conger conger]|uniref:Uncharacterized protein n=1 Tax=Conger conger TaxID=82655 RepID=A0A9Q1HU94_CONCO|nr:hypothetical protein COCON_G00169060 [Conger conger]